jgi:hypothetical protein
LLHLFSNCLAELIPVFCNILYKKVIALYFGLTKNSLPCGTRIQWIALLGRSMIDESISAPLVSTRKALRLMNADYPATLGTGPLFLFAFNEMPYAE